MINHILLGWVLALSTVVIWPDLLPLPFIIASIPAFGLLKRYPVLLGATAGLLFGQLACHRLAGELRSFPYGQVTVVAELSSPTTGAALYQRNRWLVESINGETLPWYASRSIELSWYRPPPLRLGQRYRLQVKLRPPSGYLNQGGFNRYRHQLANHIAASGYVRQGELVEDRRHWRQPLLATLAQATQELPQGDLLRTLVLADDRGVSSERWQQMRQAGLIHLLAISGLHLSIVAGLTLAVGTWLRQRLFANPYGRGRGMVWLLTAAMALLYASLAEMALPTMRATAAVLLTLLLLWQRRQGRPWELLLRVAALVLLLQPLASLAPGYWLSFGAVALILLVNWWWPLPATRWRRLVWFGRLQLLLTLALCVLQGLWFGQFSVHGVWTNLLLLPYFSLLVLPLCLLLSTVVLLGADPMLLQLADWSLWPLAQLARGASAAEFGYGTLPLLAVAVLALIGFSLTLLHARQWLAAAIALLLALAWATPPRVQWQLDMIDVGQGLALLITQDQRAMVVDTGAAFAGGFSYAEAALLPLLRQRGITQLDLLLLSHGDNDHAGGAKILAQQLPIAQQYGFGGGACGRGPKRWGQLTLHWFQAPLEGNDGSCVLLLDSGQHRLLLPGDLEAAGEQAWLAATLQPQVDVLVAPHHGSSTSSSAAFVAATTAKWVLVAAGRNNRWRFPKAEVLQRYHEQGAKVLVSGQLGQIQLRFTEDGEITASNYRQHWAPWWYNQQ
ncbi:DNA internalization-related competence protein ComEC/Rec2 [uncultured Ferrimonas sp.]|uniref:DNA internalization-related competence protein ComEC/Rec2 n=1 Tax=uncultured Ferrimonas sp. TaxID=432640 RepID=UPI00261041E1|nr:DNA internalization-related competence protein ComEC/Rec2 [uncultured Ferrimonas sp.]